MCTYTSPFRTSERTTSRRGDFRPRINCFAQATVMDKPIRGRESPRLIIVFSLPRKNNLSDSASRDSALRIPKGFAGRGVLLLFTSEHASANANVYAHNKNLCVPTLLLSELAKEQRPVAAIFVRELTVLHRRLLWISPFADENRRD